MIDIDVMARAFYFHGVPSFIGIDGVFAEEIDVWFVKGEHFGWQQEDSMVVDLAVGIEAPATGNMVQAATENNQDGFLHGIGIGQ
jgi:hypothetical protein